MAVLANIPEQQASGETDDDMGEELQACLAGNEEAESAAAKPVSLPILLHKYSQKRTEKQRKDYAFRRQFDEKPSIMPGCPGNLRTAHGHVWGDWDLQPCDT